MNNVTVKEVEQLYVKGLLPKADYANLDSFLNTISDEDLGEMVALCESEDTDKLQYLSYTIAGLFMNEYDQDECSERDLSNLFSQFKRQCVAEVCGRLGKWDTSKEDRRLVPAIEPL